MQPNDDIAARRIYDEWHEGINAGDLDRVMNCYAENAVIETPTILAIYADAHEGVLHGRENIRELFAQNFAALGDTFKGLYRTGVFLANGHSVLWEYPRLTPGGDQVDLVESMDISGGLITYHRVYWGWRGMAALLAHRERRADP